ncbi:MAG: YhcH/YjgK/YiaL family protein [Eubacteriales bacterium]|nr:YhcH/YjgK/YiaL family protein [Eubacteriales bacterium]
MIVDNLENIARYAGLGANFATAAAYLAQTDLNALPMGRTEVDGANVFINKQDNLLNQGDPAWEAHARYADIQLILRGGERFVWGATAVMDPLNEQTDFRTCHDASGCEFTLTDGQLVIFLPGEPHSPGNYAALTDRCVKLVAKVLAE